MLNTLNKINSVNIYYVPGAILDTADTASTKEVKSPFSGNFYFT